MAPSRHAEEGGQLQLMDADRVEDEEECFESIDKRTSRPLPSHLASCNTLGVWLLLIAFHVINMCIIHVIMPLSLKHTYAIF